MSSWYSNCICFNWKVRTTQQMKKRRLYNLRNEKCVPFTTHTFLISFWPKIKPVLWQQLWTCFVIKKAIQTLCALTVYSRHLCIYQYSIRIAYENSCTSLSSRLQFLVIWRCNDVVRSIWIMKNKSSSKPHPSILYQEKQLV